MNPQTKPALRRAMRGSVLALPLLWPATAARADDLADIRATMQAMQKQYQAELAKLQHDYDQKMRAMEKRVEAAEAKATSATAKAESAEKALTTAQATPLQPAVPAPALSLALEAGWRPRQASTA